MKAIQVKNGALFVKWGNFSTYRYTERHGWEVSPCLFSVVERDMQYEGPDAFDYLSEGEIRAHAEFDALRALHKKTCELLGFAFEDKEPEEIDCTVTFDDIMAYLEEDKDE